MGQAQLLSTSLLAMKAKPAVNGAFASLVPCALRCNQLDAVVCWPSFRAVP